MPRKAQEELNTNPPVSLRLPPEIRSAVVKMAEVERRSLSAQLVHLVEVALDKQEAKQPREAAAAGR